MNNLYYHAFAVGFNWCFVVAPLMLIAMVAIVWRVLRPMNPFEEDSRHIPIIVIALLFAGIFCAMLFKECSAGLVQRYLNSMLAYEDPIYGYLGAVIEIAFISSMFCALLIWIGFAVSKLKWDYQDIQRCVCRRLRIKLTSRQLLRVAICDGLINGLKQVQESRYLWSVSRRMINFLGVSREKIIYG